SWWSETRFRRRATGRPWCSAAQSAFYAPSLSVGSPLEDPPTNRRGHGLSGHRSARPRSWAALLQHAPRLERRDHLVGMVATLYIVLPASKVTKSRRSKRTPPRSPAKDRDVRRGPFLMRRGRGACCSSLAT